MAKKKSTEGTDPSTANKPAAGAKKAPVKKGATAKKPAAPAASPLIDTGLAAQAAARAVLSGRGQQNPQQPAAEESSTFKQLKESLNKPKLTGTAANLLGGTPSTNKNQQGFFQQNQKGHNQTFGSQGSRTYVPRRTSG